MKRMVCLLLITALLASVLSGCGETVREPVTFYYLQKDYMQEMDCLIASEEREAAGHRDNLEYLLGFYMMGPVSEELCSPVPRGTVLIKLSQEASRISLELSISASLQTDCDFTLTCACLALTCMNLEPVDEVTITSGSKSLTLRRDSLLFHDTIMPEEDAK